MKGLENKEILIPILHTALNDPKFKAFDVRVEEWTARPPDGYFHPSTQATWSARQMALYLMAPQLFEQERMQLTGVLAITQGHFWHMFIQHVLKESGVLVEDEIGFTDEEHKRRGHMDGLLAIKGEPQGLEIKTMNSRTIQKIVNEAALKEFKYGYWCQAQEYLDVFDLRQMRFLILNADYPFTMKEFVVNADPLHQGKRRKAYKEAIATAAASSFPLAAYDGPDCCGTPTSCAARYACQYKAN
jgi:hypothetical protein